MLKLSECCCSSALVPHPRHIVHVHDCWALHAEALPEAAPRHQCQCLQCLRLLGHRHLLFCAGRGEAPTCSARPIGKVYAHSHTCACVHTPSLTSCRRDACSFPKVPSLAPQNPAWLSSRLPPEEEGWAGGAAFFSISSALPSVAPGRSLAKGTRRSGSSSRSFTLLPPCSSAYSSITWAAGSWVRAYPGQGTGRGPAGPHGVRGWWPWESGSQATFGFTGALEESLVRNQMRPWPLCGLQRPRLLSWHRLGAGEEGPFPCRLGDRPSHSPCALHRLHPAVQRAPLRGT